MRSKQVTCPKCGRTGVRVIQLTISDSGDYIIKQVKHGPCGYKWSVTLPLNTGLDEYESMSSLCTDKNGRKYTKTEAMHRWVYRTYNNKAIKKDHIIHHVNGIKGDNRASNLVEIPRRNHHQHMVGDILKSTTVYDLTVEVQRLRTRVAELEGKSA